MDSKEAVRMGVLRDLADKVSCGVPLQYTQGSVESDLETLVDEVIWMAVNAAMEPDHQVALALGDVVQ